MGIFEKKYTVCDADGDRNSSLRMSALMRMFQECAEEDALSPGEGLAWVLVRFHMSAVTFPKSGESITVQTWPAQRDHAFYPRYYRVLDSKGQEIIAASALWVIIDLTERKMLLYGIEKLSGGVVTGFESRLPKPPRKMEAAEVCSFTVPEDYIDKNGHMNNTRYFDVIDMCIGRVRPIREVEMEYTGEAFCGDSIRLFKGNQNEKYYVEGKLGERLCFRCEIQL